MRKLKSMVRGFTLIELLIVLAVIAALLAIITPIALNAVAQAKATQVASNLRNIKLAVESYVNVEKQASATIANLVQNNYLPATPTNYYVIVPATLTSIMDFVVGYSGGDVDINRVRNVYPDVEASGTTDIIVRFKVAKWW